MNAITGSGFTSVSLAGTHACAISAAGLSCFGQGDYGALGNGTEGPTGSPEAGCGAFADAASPAAITTPTGLLATEWTQVVTSGTNSSIAFTCAIHIAGASRTLWC